MAWWDEWWRRWRSSFRSMDEFMRQFEKMVEEMFKEFEKDFSKDFFREVRPLVWGWSITIGPDGKPVIREFGNVKPSLKGFRPSLDIKTEREPLVDVFSEDGSIKVVAELPGVEKQDIKLHATPKTLTISVNTPQRKYYKELELPAEIDPKTAKSVYRNGVLEVTLKKVEEKPKGEPIKID